MRETTRASRSSLLALACLLIAAWLAVRSQLFVSWTPGDEGVLGQSAERLLRGELPHRDYVALWSGGLDVLNAAAFRLFGTTLVSLRIILVVGWLAGLAAMFAIARRFVSPWIAAALGVAAAEWTLPLSPHPLPSWYTLFISLGATVAVARYLDSRRRRWLAVAGAAAAAACAVKITGLYFVAAVAMLFVWLVQEGVPGESTPRGGARPYAWVITLGLIGHLLLVALVFSGVASVNAGVHYLLPAVVLDGALVWREWRLPSDGDAPRFRRLWSLVWPFAAGAGVIFGAWLAPYAASGALGDLWSGLFVTPRLRFLVASYPLPGLRSAGVAVLPLALLLTAAPYVRRPLRQADRLAVGAGLLIAGALAFDGSPTVLVTWYGFRLLTPVCAVLAVWWLMRDGARHGLPADRRALAFLLVAAAVMSSLVQVPFALYTYFLYFLPLLLLALAGVVAAQPAMPRVIPAALLAYCIWFGFRQPDSLARPASPDRDRPALLALARGGIAVSPADSAKYVNLVRAIERHRPGDWIYVWHDAPEVYFLAGKRNPTRTIFEAFDDSVSQTTANLRERLTRRDVRVVVFTDPDGAVRPMAADFRAWVDSTFPANEWVGRSEVRWRVVPPGGARP